MGEVSGERKRRRAREGEKKIIKEVFDKEEDMKNTPKKALIPFSSQLNSFFSRWVQF